ncbi:MAG: hypothetical protein ACYC67_26800 [Prosthecobacter sp.]
MIEEPPSAQPMLAKVAVYLSGAAMLFFVTGLVTGGIEPHRDGEETSDMIALILCRIASPLLAMAAWSAGFAALLKRPSGPAWSALTVMLFILMFLVLFCYSAWRGTAAFHPTMP